ncbi:ABC transporter substrate-binding protein [[Limnothrix rosea] IAM M-220]|uniref:ABC transporter substrate-binding protein n=1 Tax=[Limnothrix rosea] IAM M-220 TaxID=454133 RepID=UPI0011159B78|nr:ABC transporter substrate-binding protein [[Limnothrix rosea] IAM M-220]
MALKGSKFDWRLGGLFGVALSVVGAIGLFGRPDLSGILWRSPEAESVVYFDRPARVSEGEQLILANYHSPLKDAGIVAYREGNYSEAERLFQDSLSVERDPEALIYLNNARVRQEDKYLTVAVTVNLADDLEVGVAKEILKGVAQAQKEFIEQGNNLKVVIGDDDSNVESAIALANKFVASSEILGVIGHYSSALSFEAGQIYQDAGLVMITHTAAAPDLTNIGDFIFRTGPNNLYFGEAIVDHVVNEFQVGKLGVFYSSKSPYSSSLQRVVVNKLGQHDGTDVVVIDADRPGFDVDEDFSILAAENVGAIALLLDRYTTPHSVAIIEKNNRALPIISGDDAIDNDWQTSAEAEASLGLVAPVPWHALTNPSALFPVDSRDLWIENVSWRTAMAYDATRALLKGLQEAAEYERHAVQAVLADPDFVTQGAADEIIFSDNGDRQHSLKIVKVVRDERSEKGFDFVPLDVDSDVAAEFLEGQN